MTVTYEQSDKLKQLLAEQFVKWGEDDKWVQGNCLLHCLQLADMYQAKFDAICETINQSTSLDELMQVKLPALFE